MKEIAREKRKNERKGQGVVKEIENEREGERKREGMGVSGREQEVGENL